MKAKKFLAGVLTMAAVFTVCATSAFAAAPSGGGQSLNCNYDGGCQNCGTSHQFVDADGDGVCDNWPDGVCQNCGTSHQFVDADEDGVCDNWTDGKCPKDGTGKRAGHGHGRGHADANGSGSHRGGRCGRGR